jgi:hypothetical protein
MAPLEREEPPLCDFSRSDSLRPRELHGQPSQIPFNDFLFFGEPRRWLTEHEHSDVAQFSIDDCADYGAQDGTTASRPQHQRSTRSTNLGPVSPLEGEACGAKTGRCIAFRKCA